MTHIDATAPETLLRHGIVSGHERLNQRLRPLLLGMAERIPDKGTNKAAGESYFRNKWLSARDLHTLPDPEMRTLIAIIHKAANSLAWPSTGPGPLQVGVMWAIVSRSGMEGKPHKHSGRVSGAYYVDAGACAGENGAFAVYGPDGKMVRTITPETGMLMLFPNTLWHGVLRYDSDEPRIVLSFNLF